MKADISEYENVIKDQYKGSANNKITKHKEANKAKRLKVSV